MEGIWLSFSLGVASAASPCLLPLYPSFLAYLTANGSALEGRRGTGMLGFLILAGVLSTMLAVAVVLVAVSVPIGLVLGFAIPIVDGILITLGVLLLAGRNPFERLPGARVPAVRSPYGQAYVYGLMLGPLALPCAGAFALSIIAYSVGLAETLPRIAIFLAYGLGFGLPLLILSLLAGANRQRVVQLVVGHRRAIEVVGGVLLIGVGTWDLLVNVDNIRTTFGI